MIRAFRFYMYVETFHHLDFLILILLSWIYLFILSSWYHYLDIIILISSSCFHHLDFIILISSSWFCQAHGHRQLEVVRARHVFLVHGLPWLLVSLLISALLATLVPTARWLVCNEIIHLFDDYIASNTQIPCLCCFFFLLLSFFLFFSLLPLFFLLIFMFF
jgi:hypothetical protein